MFKPLRDFPFIIKDKLPACNCEIAGNDVINILTSEDICKIRHSGPRCSFVRILRVFYFPVKHSCLYNKSAYTVLFCVPTTCLNKLFLDETDPPRSSLISLSLQHEVITGIATSPGWNLVQQQVSPITGSPVPICTPRWRKLQNHNTRTLASANHQSTATHSNCEGANKIEFLRQVNKCYDCVGKP